VGATLTDGSRRASTTAGALDCAALLLCDGARPKLNQAKPSATNTSAPAAAKYCRLWRRERPAEVCASDTGVPAPRPTATVGAVPKVPPTALTPEGGSGQLSGAEVRELRPGDVGSVERESHRVSIETPQASSVMP